MALVLPLKDLARRALLAQRDNKHLIVTPEESQFLRHVAGTDEWTGALIDAATLEGLPVSNGNDIVIEVRR